MSPRIKAAVWASLAFTLVFIACRTGSPRNAAAGLDPAIASIETFIAHEMKEKSLPALSIALVDDQKIIWAKGFGEAVPKAKTAATADTVYRVGSVSKLFTDLAVMQLVEQGKLDLDKPVTDYIPEFTPKNSFNKPITLRQLMSHRSGLVRETPIGNYFDPDEPTLAKTIESLNRTSLVYEPETRIKYSNAGIATVGYVLERTQKEAFPKYLKRSLLDPMGLKQSSFEPEPDLVRNLATAFMWTVDNRTFEAPKFQLGIGPAGCMYTTVNDLGRFMSILFAGGRNGVTHILKPETLAQMWTPQFARPGEKNGYGIGFRLSEFEGRRMVGHGGAIYGFATSFVALPDEKLGAVVVTTMDSVNTVTQRIGEYTLSAALAARAGKAVPPAVTTTPIDPEAARRAAGRYVNDKSDQGYELMESGGKLFGLSISGGSPFELRQLGQEWIADGRLDYGRKFVLQGDKLTQGQTVFTRVASSPPPPASKAFQGLIGEYGWDHDILYLFEKEGKLWALIEWYEFDPLEQVSENVFKFPNRGLYPGEQLIFKRDTSGRAIEVDAASVLFKRRNVEPAPGSNQLLVKVIRPVPELLKEYITAQPPEEKGDFLPADLVELQPLDPTIKLDVRYATWNNLFGEVFYSEPRSFLQRPAAEALLRAHRKLREKGYGLLIHDGYRPWYVTKVFWEATPEDKRIFVADPSKGSRHNRGCAVDLTLYDLKSGKPIEMVSTYDETTDRAFPDYPGGTSLQRWHRRLLRDAMESEGFTVYEAEWWHFDFKDWRKYRIGNQPFDKLGLK